MTPSWTRHCQSVLKAARLAEADYVVLMEETADGIDTGIVAIGPGTAGNEMRLTMERLVAEGLAVRVQAVRKGGAK